MVLRDNKISTFNEKILFSSQQNTPKNSINPSHRLTDYCNIEKAKSGESVAKKAKLDDIDKEIE